MKTFNYQDNQVRTVEIDSEPWFVGKDVAEILGYTNTRKAIGDHVDEEDKMDGVTIRDSIGREQTPMLINESGVYSLIFSSKLPGAKAFKRWVTSEVLPSIRKTGTYSTDTKHNVAPLPPESAGGVAQLLKVIRAVMKDNGQPPEAISQAIKGMCEQFGIAIPANFVRVNPFEQMRLLPSEK